MGVSPAGSSAYRGRVHHLVPGPGRLIRSFHVQRLLAVLLVLLGLIGLVLGRLGETTWAPDTETTATVSLSDPGPAVLIDPGVLYVGGEEGTVTIEGASDVSIITASNADLEAYLEGTRYTRITGASDWTTLSTQEVNPDGSAELTDPTTSDLWRSVETIPSPATIDVADFHAGEHGENAQVYRAILIVTDGTAPGADQVSITWPVHDENEWVPFAYAGGAAVAVIGLVLLVVSLGGRRRERLDEDEIEETEESDALESAEPGASAPIVVGGSAAAGAAGDADDRADAEDADAWSVAGAPADRASADGEDTAVLAPVEAEEAEEAEDPADAESAETAETAQAAGSDSSADADAPSDAGPSTELDPSAPSDPSAESDEQPAPGQEPR